MNSTKTYYTRVSVALVTFITAAFAVPIVMSVLCAEYVVMFICVAVLLLTYGLLFSIRYRVEDGKLKIYTLFWHQDISVEKINRVEPSSCLISSPAASLDRLAIYWGDKNKVVYISPRHQEEFLREINAVAHLDEKK